MHVLPLSFYQRPVLEVARALLGTLLIRTAYGRTVTGRIVEVEAYREDDPASHSFRGRTPRNSVMFGPGGRIYVYFTYGMHFCANVVTGHEGAGEAVLLRAVEPVLGVGLMARRRFGRKKLSSRKELHDLTRGPARLCEAFHITRSDNGRLLNSSNLCIVASDDERTFRIGRTERIGIRNGREKRWRFFISGNEWVSGRKQQ